MREGGGVSERWKAWKKVEKGNGRKNRERERERKMEGRS